MKLVCVLLGHKWKAGRCVRCRVRHKDHNWTPADRKCEEICSVCGETRDTHRWSGCKCDICGKTRYLSPTFSPNGHSWNGCTCRFCGVTRDAEHQWIQSDTGCFRTCRICGKQEAVPHRYIRAEGQCVETCAVCGDKRFIDHAFTNRVCTVCGIGEDEYYLQTALKLSGNQAKSLGYAEKIRDPQMIKKYVLGMGGYTAAYTALRYIRSDQELASIAQDEKFSLDIREAARRLIGDETMKAAITLPENTLRRAMEEADARTGM